MDEMGGLSTPMSSRTSPDWVPVLSFRGENDPKVTQRSHPTPSVT